MCDFIVASFQFQGVTSFLCKTNAMGALRLRRGTRKPEGLPRGLSRLTDAMSSGLEALTVFARRHRVVPTFGGGNPPGHETACRPFTKSHENAA